MEQISFSWDKETLRKVLKGALYATTPAAGIALLQFFGTIDFSNPAFTAFVAWFVPFAVNALKEWAKGKTE